MKCRNIIKDDNGHYNLVMFGSYGLNQDGTAKKADNYLKDSDAIKAALIQKLSIIKGELWYNVSYGQPLFDKNKTKVPFDAFILKEVNNTSGVKMVESFNSKLENNTYNCDIIIQTIYGDSINLSI